MFKTISIFRKKMIHELLTRIFIFFCLVNLFSCSFFVSGPEGSANGSYKVNFKNSEWSSINPDSSDYAFINDKTKSTIIAQSYCKKFQTSSLEVLSSTILNGIEDIKIIERKEISLSNRQGLQTISEGSIDGVKVYLNLVSLQKDLCLFDFALIATTKDHLKKDNAHFEEFLQGLKL